MIERKAKSGLKCSYQDRWSVHWERSSARTTAVTTPLFYADGPRPRPSGTRHIRRQWSSHAVTLLVHPSALLYKLSSLTVVLTSYLKYHAPRYGRSFDLLLSAIDSSLDSSFFSLLFYSKRYRSLPLR